MDESRKEELFSAIYMAAQFGFHLAEFTGTDYKNP